MTNQLTSDDTASLLSLLRARFEKHPERHPNLVWNEVEAKLKVNPEKLWTLQQMEATGGEPDVVDLAGNGAITFVDCAAESPAGRRNLCYDREALDKRKEHKPANCAMDVAAKIGVKLLDEDQYRRLQQLGKFDLKTSSWILTPPAIRKLGGALFCDRRYDHVFTYHNGADSYYGARGFRGILTL